MTTEELLVNSIGFSSQELLLLREPAYNWLRGGHDIVDFAARRFSKLEIEKDLAIASLTVTKATYANFFLLLFVFLKQFFQTIFKQEKKVKSDIADIHPLLNHFFYQLLKIESILLNHTSLPWGSSLVFVAQKRYS